VRIRPIAYAFAAPARRRLNPTLNPTLESTEESEAVIAETKIEPTKESEAVIAETKDESETHPEELSNPLHTSGEPVTEDKTEVDNTLDSIINKYGTPPSEYS